MKSAYYRDITDLSNDEIRRLKLGVRRFDEMRENADELGINRDEIPEIEMLLVPPFLINLKLFSLSTLLYSAISRLLPCI